MKFCTFCFKNILTKVDEKSWDEHHPSYLSLRKSSTEGCLFCRTLEADVEHLAQADKKKDSPSEWPVYRWSIRRLAKIRESAETVVITFRWIERNGHRGETSAPNRRFFFFPENDLEPLPTADQLGNSTRPTATGGPQIKKWLQVCNENHPDCVKRRKTTPASETFVPTRLLDISVPEGSPIRVIETAKTPVQSVYVTLSHCWGLPRFENLDRKMEKLFTTEGIPWVSFTNNFKQAIEVARFLGVRYIWIDSLCIVQGDDGDFITEATKMHKVYRNSYCNIAIVDSKDSTGGVFRDRAPEDVIPARYQAEDESAIFGTKPWRAVPGHLWREELLRTFLYKRGWVFQERMLAPRILHFARHQVFWDCPLLSACETLPAGLPQPLDGEAGPDRQWRSRLQEPNGSTQPLVGANDASVDQFWKFAIKTYTGCDLTNGGDKLVAMWGIVKLVRDAFRDHYGAGLWERDLANQLAWHVPECLLEARPNESQDIKSRRKEIPSWSWASMDGVIEVPDRMTDQHHFTVKNHYGRNLAFDLVGVKHQVPSLPQDRPIQQTRLKSESDVLQKSRTPESQQRKQFNAGQGQNTRSHEDENDKQPEFHDTSIAIRGHVGRGYLNRNRDQKSWGLVVDGSGETKIEAYPDLLPRNEVSTDNHPFFIVLSAKQVVDDTRSDGLDECPTLGKYADPDKEKSDSSEYTISGNGILMKDTGNSRFRRTGAFFFHGVSREAFDSLQFTYDSAALSSQEYNPKHGRKFWLY